MGQGQGFGGAPNGSPNDKEAQVSRTLALKASGTVGRDTQRAILLLVFSATEGGAGQVATLKVADGRGNHATSHGRVFGIGEDRTITFSTVVGRDASDRPQFADLLRVKWNRASNHLAGTFFPPRAAAELGALYRRVREDAPSSIAAACRSQIATLAERYGQSVAMEVRMVAPGLGKALGPN